MQLELERRAIQSYDNLYSANTIKEESADIIVPDSYPDILRIIDARGLVCLKEKRCTDSGVELIGAVHISVLYAPDVSEESESAYTPVRLGMVIPYQHLFEHRNLSSDTKIVAEINLTAATARTINPRKVQVAASVFLDVKCYATTEMQLCRKVNADAEAGLETLTKVIKAQLPCSVRDKNFAVTDMVELPSGRPLIADILHAGVRLVTRESKVIGNKAVFKGGAILAVLYSTEGGEGPVIATWEQELPFSQIVEMENLDESSMVNMSMILMGMELGVNAPARTIDVELQIEAQVQAISAEHLEVLTDAYSTKYHVLPEMHEMCLTNMTDTINARAQVRETAQIQPPIHSIVDTEIRLSAVSMSSENGTTRMNSQATVLVMYLTDDNDYETASFVLPVDTMIENPDMDNCEARAMVAGDVFSGVSADGMEIRFNVSFEGTMSQKQQCKVINDIKGDWENPKEQDLTGASVMLRRVGTRESLWDIAKSYSTTSKDILAANAMTETVELSAGSMLLIPRKR